MSGKPDAGLDAIAGFVFDPSRVEIAAAVGRGRLDMGLRPMHDPVAQLAPPPHRSQKRNLAAIVALVLTGAGTGYRIGRVAQASMYPLPVGAAEVAVAFACREVEATRESIREALALGLGMDPGVWQLTRDLPHDLEQRAEKNPRP